MTSQQQRQALIAQAAARHSQYPQYVGHWDDWGLGVMSKRVRTKLGVAAEKGDVVLLAPDEHSARFPLLPGERFSATIYSWRNGIDTAVDPRAVRRLELA